ncbi:MAG TPA: hypothetical protein VF669_20425 [Tepidisphaeraceae bacterium]
MSTLKVGEAAPPLRVPPREAEAATQSRNQVAAIGRTRRAHTPTEVPAEPALILAEAMEVPR